MTQFMFVQNKVWETPNTFANLMMRLACNSSKGGSHCHFKAAHVRKRLQKPILIHLDGELKELGGAAGMTPTIKLRVSARRLAHV